MKKDLWIKIVVAVIVIAIAVTTIIIFKGQMNHPADESGKIVVELEGLGKEKQTFEVSFEEGDTLVGVLEKNFTMLYDETQITYGKLILGVNEVVTDFNTTYIAIYVDGEYSTLGISSIPLTENMVLLFKETAVSGYGD